MKTTYKTSMQNRAFRARRRRFALIVATQGTAALSGLPHRLAMGRPGGIRWPECYERPCAYEVSRGGIRMEIVPAHDPRGQP